MRKDITFEAQVRADGDWRTIGVFGDRETAVSEAERVFEAKRTPAARVRQVIFDHANNECMEHTVFRASALDDSNARPRARATGADIFQRGRERPKTRPTQSSNRRRWPALTALGLLGLAGLAATLLLR